jgi:hypothetical protein
MQRKGPPALIGALLTGLGCTLVWAPSAIAGDDTMIGTVYVTEDDEGAQVVEFDLEEDDGSTTTSPKRTESRSPSSEAGRATSSPQRATPRSPTSKACSPLRRNRMARS